MTRHLGAIFLTFACGVGAPVFAQDPAPAPVVLPVPDPATRQPVNTKPAQPAAPVKLEPAPPDAASGAPTTKGETPADEPDQGRGGSRGGRGGGSRPAPPHGQHPGAPRGPVYHRPGWGPMWGPPPAYYFAHPYYWDPFWVSGAFAWSPLYYAPWPLMWGTVGYWPGSYWGPPTTFMTGGVRLKVKPRDAQVIVDGYYAGVVDEFDGVFQSLRLAPGGHKIEIRLDGFETITFDVHVQPDRTLTLTQNMRPKP